MTIDPHALLAPIAGDDPAGADISFGDLYDQIREARRADDAQLDQGDWQIERKVANWRRAAQLAEQALREQSKDLQLAVWLVEAWIQQHGLDGAQQGFVLLEGLLNQYWAALHPRMDDGDAEERASKLAWLGNYGGMALRQLALAPGHAGTSLNDWQASRDVDNLSRQNRDAYEAALADGKPTGEAYDAALLAGGAALMRKQCEAIQAAGAAFTAMEATIDRLFGRDAPSLAGLSDTLKRMDQVVARAAQTLGVAAPGGASSAATPEDNTTPAGTGAGVATTPVAHAAPALNLQANNQAAKADALRMLGDIAAFFKRTEPHSPVASLLERAVVWADMPLQAWLQEVVRDDSVLAAIHDRIGLARPEQ